MFSKYKKPNVPKDVAGKPSINIAQPAKSNAPSEEARQPLMKAMKPRSGADTGTMDKEKRRKERLGEIKLELHKALLDNFFQDEYPEAQADRPDLVPIVQELLQYVRS